jgi:hypothetical protein
MINAVAMTDNDLNVEGLSMFGLVSVGVTSLQPLLFIYCCSFVLMNYNGLDMSSATAKKRKKHCTGGALKTEISQVDVVALLISEEIISVV